MGDFNSFLSRMSGETTEKAEQPPVRQPAPASAKPKPQPRPARKPEPIAEDLYDWDEPELEPVAPARRPERQAPAPRIDEEFMDKAYDYAQSVVRVVRQNSDFNKEERRIILESIVKSISTYMSDMYGPAVSYQMQQRQAVSTASNYVSPVLRSPTMSEAEWNAMPNVIYENQAQQNPGYSQNPAFTPAPQKPTRVSDAYDGSLRLGTKPIQGAMFHEEVDMSAVSHNEIRQMQVLAGIIDAGGKPTGLVDITAQKPPAGATSPNFVYDDTPENPNG